MCVSCVRGYDVESTPLKRTCHVCRKIAAVHKSGRNEVRMRSTIVAVLSLFMATAVMAVGAEGRAAASSRTTAARPAFTSRTRTSRTRPHMAGLDDRISVHVQNFGTLLKKANGNCQGIVLFLDGMPIKGDKAESCDPVAGHVRYRLLRHEG